MRKKIMVMGLGVLGGYLLDMLLRMVKQHDIIIAGRNIEKLRERVNLADLVAIQLGHYPNVTFEQIDILNVDHTAEVINKIKPDIIFNATSLMSYWVPSQLPREIWGKLYYAYTGWQVPMHITLIYKLMHAIKQSGHKVRVVNGAYPDVTNVSLSKIDMAPEIGIGNIANVIPVIRKSISFHHDILLEDVEVRLFGHHFFSYRLPTIGSDIGLPYHINVYVNNIDITDKIDLPTIFSNITTNFKRTRGQVGMTMTAASSMNVLEAMANNLDKKIVHAPGPNGLPGGYPVLITDSSIKVVLPENLTLQQAIQINEEGQRLDGVKEIDKHGTVYFTDKEMSIVKEIFGYECLAMRIQDCEHWAKELKTKYSEFSDSIAKQLI